MSFKQHEHQVLEYRENGSLRIRTLNDQPTMTQQQFAEDCDVNKILARLLKTGQIPQFHTKTGTYGDFSEMPSYHDALKVMISAKNSFDQLPIEIKARFGQDPQQLIDYLKDEKNNDEAIRLGLKLPKQTPAPDPNTELLKEIAANTKSKKATSADS